MGRPFKELTAFDCARGICIRTGRELRIGREKLKGLESLAFRVLSEDVTSKIDVPFFPRASQDGFAVIANDTFGSSANDPVILKLRPDGSSVSPGTCVRIHTGRPIPPGADGIAVREKAEVSADGTFVEIKAPTIPGLYISPRGEDIKVGARVLERGTILTPSRIGVLAAIGRTSAYVYKKPLVGIIATGNEIITPGARMEKKEFKTYDVNSYTLRTAVESLGCNARNYGIARDNEKSILSALKKALRECDAVITNAGSSVGDVDYTVSAINRAGCRLLFHGVAIRPGKPTALAVSKNKKMVMCLPGFPASALAAFNMLAVPAINALRGVDSGVEKKEKPAFTYSGKLTHSIPSTLGTVELVRVSIDAEHGLVTPIAIHGSGMITSISRADGWIIIPPNVEGLKAGDLVSVEGIPTEEC